LRDGKDHSAEVTLGKQSGQPTQG
ncbi:MAG: hypothetical protein QOG68_1068, partial [Solirubrobacteraceae bacterium]|nr:hypothetical protein [Solirubrobacteraceae bacterium]